MGVNQLKNCLVVVLFTLAITAMGGQQVLIKSILSDKIDKSKKERIELAVEVDDQGVIQLLRENTYQYGRIVEVQRFHLYEIKRPNGVVLAKEGKRDIIRLSAPNRPGIERTGGKIKINYLYNGIKNKRKSVYYSMKRVNGIWNLYTDRGQKVRTMTIIPNKMKLLGKVIGISKIKIN
ncbi:hypothetical protein N9N67_12185 [Bacteriovoracaceae bacterium]|nr:hypothetical protein [Bacteriovoracaceae bacterium]